MQICLYSFVDLPPLPDHLEQSLLDRANSTKAKENTYVKLSVREQIQTNVLFDRTVVSDDITQWVVNNITADYKNITSALARPRTDGYESTHRISPHNDVGRNWTLNYYTECGGTVYTIWYKSKNFPLVIPSFVRFDTDLELEEVTRILIPPRTWVLLNVRVLHDALGIVGDRSSLMIDFEDLPESIQRLKINSQFQILDTD